MQNSHQWDFWLFPTNAKIPHQRVHRPKSRKQGIFALVVVYRFCLFIIWTFLGRNNLHIQYTRIINLLKYVLYFAFINTFFLTCTIVKFSPSFITITNKCFSMTRPMMITMTIILTFEYYGRIIKLNIYHTYANDIHYFEVTYQSNLFAHPIQDCRNILHCCKCLDHYNHHCLYMKKLWKKESPFL